MLKNGHEIGADGRDDRHRRKQARRQREVGGGTPQGVGVGSHRGANVIPGDAARDEHRPWFRHEAASMYGAGES